MPGKRMACSAQQRLLNVSRTSMLGMFACERMLIQVLSFSAFGGFYWDSVVPLQWFKVPDVEYSYLRSAQEAGDHGFEVFTFKTLFPLWLKGHPSVLNVVVNAAIGVDLI